MNVGAQDKKKLAIAGVAGVGALAAVIYLYTQLFPPEPPPVASTPVILSAPMPGSAAAGRSTAGAATTAATGTLAKPLATTAASLDPTLHMGPMLTTEALVYRGSGRNIFSTEAAAPAALPKAQFSPRPPVTQTTYTPPGPPALPRIDLRFFGTATSGAQAPRAFLLRGEDVFLASVGDIVQRRYKILAITANAVTVEDLTNNNQQSLPFIPN